MSRRMMSSPRDVDVDASRSRGFVLLFTRCNKNAKPHESSHSRARTASLRRRRTEVSSVSRREFVRLWAIDRSARGVGSSAPLCDLKHSTEQYGARQVGHLYEEFSDAHWTPARAPGMCDTEARARIPIHAAFERVRASERRARVRGGAKRDGEGRRLAEGSIVYRGENRDVSSADERRDRTAGGIQRRVAEGGGGGRSASRDDDDIRSQRVSTHEISRD